MKKITLFLTCFFSFSFAFGQTHTQPGNGKLLNGQPTEIDTIPGTDLLIMSGVFTGTNDASIISKFIGINDLTQDLFGVTGTNGSFITNGYYDGPDGLFRAYGRYPIGSDVFLVVKFNTNTSVVGDPYFKCTGTQFQMADAVESNGLETIIIGNISEINGTPVTKAASVSPLGTVTDKPNLNPGTGKVRNIKWNDIDNNWKIVGQYPQLGTTSTTNASIYDGNSVIPITGLTDAGAYCSDYVEEFIAYTGNNPSSGLAENSGNNAISTGTGYLMVTQDAEKHQGEIYIGGPPKGPSGPSNRGRTASYNPTTGVWTNRDYDLFLPGTDNLTNLTISGLKQKNNCLYKIGNFGLTLNGIQTSNCYWVAKVCIPPSVPLAVKLDSFQVKNTRQINLLTWNTKSEINNDRFEIEKSSDGFDFEKIGFIKGKNHASNYSFKDENPKKINYYRLKQIDFDGRFEYSEVISIKNEDYFEEKIYPNPFVDYINIKTKKTEISIIDIFGKIIFYRKIENDEINSIQIDLSNLNSGIYFLRLGEETQKITK